MSTIPHEVRNIYDWFELQAELCKLMGISEDNFRDYHGIVGGDYKDFWHVCLETIVPDNMSNGTIVCLYSTEEEWFIGDDAWKNLVLVAWNKLYSSIEPSGLDSGILVNFSW